MASDENQTAGWNNFWSRKAANSDELSWSKKRILKIISPLLPGRNKILDAGCGSGFFSRFFLSENKTVFSIDNSTEALELCRKNVDNKSHLRLLDLTNQSISSELATDIDLIFTDGLLEHFSMPMQLKILENFRESLSANGVVVTIVPNKFSFWQILRPFYLPGIKEEPLTLRQLEKLHMKAGLKIVLSGGLNVLPAKWSPESSLGKYFGMLVYTVAVRVQR